MVNDINFFQDENCMPIASVSNLDNSESGYYIGYIRSGFALIIIRKYIFGHVYIWRKIGENGIVPNIQISNNILNRKRRR